MCTLPAQYPDASMGSTRSVSHADLLEDVQAAIGDRSLVWFGIRAADARSLLEVGQFRFCFGITAPMNATRFSEALTLEELTGSRVDLDAYDIDFDDRQEVTELRRSLLHRMSEPCVVATYRPSHFLTSLQFPTAETSRCVGLFKDQQTAFEHKPWVETELRRKGIPCVPWRYVAEEHRSSVLSDLERGPIVLRASRTSGGVGIELASTASDLREHWPTQREHFVGVAPFLAEAIPLNVGGVVWSSGAVTLHPGSLQLIGVSQLTNRRFGYCGNDFAAFAGLGAGIIREVDTVVRAVGQWLAHRSYIGAFGVDLLVDDGRVMFSEVNARLQGSSALSSELAGSAGRSGVVLEHLAAVLGCEPTASYSLAQWARDIPPASQLIRHHLGGDPIMRTTLSDPLVRSQLGTSRPVTFEVGSALERIVADFSVTHNGFTLTARASAVLAEFSAHNAQQAVGRQA